MWRALSAILAVGLLGCGDNHVRPPADAFPEEPDGAPSDAGIEALGPCLDRPTDLPRPPTGQLPCDLLPPGFAP